MTTLRLFAENHGDIETAAALLRSGEAVSIPTETVYGLACILTEEAAAKVFAAKGRPADNPFIVHIAEPDELQSAAKDIPDAAYKLAEVFWPGPLTMVLNKRDTIPLAVTAGLDTAAVRCPAHPAAREVIRLTGAPLAAPSANLSGKPSPTSAAHVLYDLDGVIAAVLDGGGCSVGLESTVISLTGETPRLLRPGGITPEELRAVTGTLVIDPAVMGHVSLKNAPSPGMMHKHYAPNTRLTILPDDTASIPAEAVVLIPAEDSGLFNGAVCIPYTPQTLFDVLRRLDTMGLDEAFVRCPKPEGAGLAVYNRLYRACEGRVYDTGERSFIRKKDIV